MFEILRRFFKFCDAENRRKFHLSIALGVVNSFFMALRIAAVAVMIQGVILNQSQGRDFEEKTIWLSFGIILVSTICAIITKKNMSMLQTEGGYRTCAKKRIEIAEHLRYLPMGYFNANSLGQITSVTTNTMELVGDVATRAVMLVTQGLLDSALIIFMIFFFDWRIALVALAGFLLFQFVNVFMRLAVKNISSQKTQADEAQIEKILEYIQGIAEVKAYNLTGSRRKDLNAKIDRCIKNCIGMEMRCIPISALQSLVAKLTGVAIMFASIFFYLGGTMELANCAVMLICSFMLFTALEAGGNYSALLRIIDIGVKKAQAILDLPTMDIEGAENRKSVKNDSPSRLSFSFIDKTARQAGLAVEPVENTICAQNITFAYDKRKIIDGVSLTIPAGSTTAFVGPSGGGKTTLCHLLSRFWDVDSGSVTLAGKNVRDYDMDSLMKNFSFVFQNVYLFHDTIANNIRFGQPEAPMEKVIEAAKKACCHEFISALPDGYNTVIWEGGANLSGGERQRISIARAIMKDAPIIILDEATANVDPENERDLMAAVSELTKEKTVIMIAHRLKTVRNANQIFVIDKGKIAESGTHGQLVKKNGIYARFIESRKAAVSWKL
ncbi:ABC-type multidrug transport system, ATPase and permease component [Treponema sp. JC4]|uniref:ABC transporter ATP-binding protein n=1 Tax=Treponema sp. JC4 TaxID=1124982 RepID=UPI00025B0A00|nr:ABC transporter ATP-binding protein [Treponema sp. JC4]EID85704.1 ABC-type multidrug transport system, ATPase and permease component [Treponema sp. JC4]